VGASISISVSNRVPETAVYLPASVFESHLVTP
jgi:hypothetical protein